MPIEGQQSNRLLYSLTATWLLAVITALFVLVHYEFSGTVIASEASANWPRQSTALRLADAKFTLLVFLHPRCPCSAATLRELEKLLADCPEQAEATAVFCLPDSTERKWAETRLWHKAQSIPGLNSVIVNANDISAFAPGASGETFLFDTDGKRIFRGGITASRGHEGDNAGRTTIATLLNGGRPDFRSFPVFGCALPMSSPAPDLKHSTASQR